MLSAQARLFVLNLGAGRFISKVLGQREIETKRRRIRIKECIGGSKSEGLEQVQNS